MQPKYPTIPGLTLLHQGKVRETYETTDPGLLLVAASDRVSTHNVVHKSTLRLKGEVLTAMTVFWLTEVLKGLPNHLVAYGTDIYDFLPASVRYPENLHYRTIVVQQLTMDPLIEYIFRERMAGSLWKDFYKKGLPNPYGLILPEGMQLMSPFVEPLFTPTDKSDTDDPMNAEDVETAYPDQVQLAYEAYRLASEYARSRGIEIIDTKLEIGTDPLGKVTLADEIFTPDSSRFVRSSDIIIGQEPPWADKQILREEAERIWAGGAKVPLTFGPEVLENTTNAYLRVFEDLTGLSLGEFQEIEFPE